MKKILVFCALLSTAFSAFATCVEDDGGKQIQKAGEVYVRHFKECSEKKGSECLAMASREKDFCLNSKTLREYWCEGDAFKMENIECTKGCRASRCN